MEREENEFSNVSVGLRRGCGMSSWLFDTYLDGIGKEINGSIMGIGDALVTSVVKCPWEVKEYPFMNYTTQVLDSGRPERGDS